MTAIFKGRKDSYIEKIKKGTTKWLKQSNLVKTELASYSGFTDI
jgi:hypothetical protein